MLKKIAASADGEALPTNVVSMPWPWAAVLPRSAASKWAYNVFAVTDTYPELRAESLIIDPDAELEDGCIVVAMFGGGHPQTMSWRNNHGRGYGGRFAAKGSLEETFLLDSMVCGRGPSSCIRILGRVFGDRRRFPRYRTWNDPAV
ncbi:hypothetical protein [Mesorhizobium sp. L103C105A0]|uniref:hypothetical protein n=1 Tax=unclassified Mesorhizobium TaxID=325217 RepID=UPI0003D0158D|nr:hypothetical protein [Mesorhizobium sp. L103C105A0]ESZ77593.1 hypothetical protein X726_06290 [Mesorhizobium sp. L103C105A0]